MDPRAVQKYQVEGRSGRNHENLLRKNECKERRNSGGYQKAEEDKRGAEEAGIDF